MEYIYNLFMGNERSIKKVNFEDIQQIWKNNQPILLINTLSDSEQNCLIKRTVSVKDEVRLINEYIRKPSIKIIVYGKNTSEISPYKKIEQLTSLGFYNVFLYPGGLFEWLCLQDIYGYEEFPTTTNELDLLKFKPISAFTFRLKDID
jgi:hypothetical protein